MIYTNWGSIVTEIIAHYPETASVDLKLEGQNKVFRRYLYELKADNGINEIQEAIKKL